MEYVRELIKEHYAASNALFVFPSEIIASFWRKEAFRITGLNVIDPRRFASWDYFKEEAFSLFRKRKPVNAPLRTVFAFQVLEMNETDGGELRGIISPDYAENSGAFLQYIVRILPSLRLVEEISGLSRKVDKDLEDTLGTLRRLYHRYEEFLLRHGLFEPGYEKPDLSAVERPVLIFFPELIEDYGENKNILEKNPYVTLVPLRGEGESTAKFRLFENTLGEFDWLFTKLIHLLKEGTSHSDIAVTICDRNILMYFQNAAEQYPLSFVYRGGLTVTEYRSGRFFIHLRECVVSNFHIEELKILLLSRGVPWKERELIERLILQGVDSFYTREEPYGGSDGRKFRHALEASGDNELLNFFISLHRAIKGIVESETIGSLRKNIIFFSSTFFDQGDWDTTNSRVFEYALNTLAEMEISLGGTELPNNLTPFSLYLHILQNSVYVPRQEISGIAVYPYRVAAGIAPRYHFIISTHHAATQVTLSRWDFLRKDYKEALDLVDTEIGPEFLRAYAGSGGDVFLTCGIESFSGQVLVPAYFMDRFEEEPEARNSDKVTDPYKAERFFWASGAKTDTPKDGTEIFPLQKRGIAAMLNRLDHRDLKPLVRYPITVPELKNTIQSRLKKDGVLEISPTRLERFTRCPFSFLFDCLLGRDEQAYESVYYSAGILGAFLHEVLRCLYAEFAREPGRSVPEDKGLFDEALDRAIEKIGKKYYGRGYSFLFPVQSELKGKAKKWISALHELEQARFPGVPIADLEVEITADESDYVLRGRIDRLSGTTEAAVIIDYKTTNRVTATDITGTDTVPPVSFQIPMYIYLVEREGRKVDRAGYISLSDSKYLPLIKSEEDPKGRLERETIDGCITVTRRYAGEMNDHVNRGHYPVPEDDCTPCIYRRICRTKYSIA